MFIERSSLEAYVNAHPTPVASVRYDAVSVPVELTEAFERFCRERGIFYRVKVAKQTKAIETPEAEPTDEAEEVETA